MNKTVENDIFGFSEVKWLHLTAEVDKSVRRLCQICAEINVPKPLSPQVDKLLKSVTRGQCDSRPMDTFPAAGHHRPQTSSNI